MGVGPACLTSLPTGFSKWELGYVSHSWSGSLYFWSLAPFILYYVCEMQPNFVCRSLYVCVMYMHMCISLQYMLSMRERHLRARKSDNPGAWCPHLDESVGYLGPMQRSLLTWVALGVRGLMSCKCFFDN